MRGTTSEEDPYARPEQIRQAHGKDVRSLPTNSSDLTQLASETDEDKHRQLEDDKGI